MRTRIIKLDAFRKQMLDWLKRDVGMKPPMDQVALVLIFIAGSYIPALFATIIFSLTCRKPPPPPKFDPALFTFNKPDAVEIAQILKIVGEI